MKPAAVNWILGTATPVACAVLWWAGSAESANPFFPPLASILGRFEDLWLFDHFGSDVLVSLGNLAVGYVLAVVIGVVLGFLFATVAPVRWMFEPVVHFVRGIPPVALVPILITVIGFGAEMRIASIVLAALFPTLIATMDGIRSVDGVVRDVCAVYRLGPMERMARVYLPSAGPRIASGMQVSLQIAFIVMIASEMLGSSQGIGAMTLLAQQSFLAADMWAGILLLGLIGFLTNLVFDIAKSRALAWYIGSRRQERAS
ncbi:ABC transporter permease [Sinomonas halotolerans]|uniref:ABC transporter permease subunit n=1 Tax=Sinomonas halotolerans TaxID=1644133 RepID=A0ABU9WWU3_9MICC